MTVAGSIDATGAPGADGGDVVLSAAHHVVVTPTGAIVARAGTGPGTRGGDVSLLSTGYAGDLFVAAGAVIDVSGVEPGQAGGDVVFGPAEDVVLDRAVLTRGDVASGDCVVNAPYIVVTGAIDTSSGGTCGYGPGTGGDIALNGVAAVMVSGALDASGAALCGGRAGEISIFATDGDVVVANAVTAVRGFASNTFRIVASGDVQLTGPTNLRGVSGFGYSAPGGHVLLDAGGSLLAAGTIDVRGGLDELDVYDAGGSVALSANGSVTAGPIDAYGFDGGAVTIASTTGDVATASVRTAANEAPNAGAAGAVTIAAGRDATVGPLDAFGAGYPGVVTISAGRHASLAGVAAGSNVAPAGGPFVVAHVDGTLEVDGPIVYPAVGAGPPVVDLSACRFRINGAIAPHGGSNPGAAVRFVAGDVLTVRAPISAAPAGQILMTTRLALPYSPEFEAAGAATPAPTIVHDPTLPPCLAIGAASLAATPNVAAFAPFVVEAAGPPLRPLLVVVGVAPGPWPLGGALGYAQVSPIGAAVLADPGVLGAPLAGSTLDAAGRWTFSVAVPPGLAGLVLTTAAFVIDGEAANGLFHQPPAVVTLCE